MRGKLSVVIATLGGQILYDTVKSLNEGTVVPDEIILCVPEENARAIPHLPYPNVSIVRTAFRGQVRQRAFGFTKAKFSYVMQFDDDLIIERDAIETMLENLKGLPENSCIAPSLMVLRTGQSFYKQPNESPLFRLYYFLLNGNKGYRSGSITLAGTNVGVDPTLFIENITESQWLPGGCILHRRENLVTENYYPFKGKAFCEDLYHSFYLKQKGVKMFFDNRAVVWVGDAPELSLKMKVKNLMADFNARKELLSYYPTTCALRFYFYYIINLFRFLT